jgi:hypothetical protein
MVQDFFEDRVVIIDVSASGREQRKALRRKELKALEGILTAEQREKVKDFVEDHSELL